MHLLQDLSEGLTKWFASRVDARWVVRKNLENLDVHIKTQGN